MLLTQLQETISRRAKTTEELQKMLDAADCFGLEAISPTEAKVVETIVAIRNIITPGRLPFKVVDQEGLATRISIALPTLQSFESSGLEHLTVDEFSIDRIINNKGPGAAYPNKLKNLRGTPKTKQLNVNNAPELNSLEGIQLEAGGKLNMQGCPVITSVEEAVGLGSLTVSDCPMFKLKGVPQTIRNLDIRYNTFKTGLPWIVTVPKDCNIAYYDLGSGNPFLNINLPPELGQMIVQKQARGQGSKVDILEVQQALIDADLDDLAKL